MKLIAGVDEAGRGCLAGPVIAAAVIISDNQKINKAIKHYYSSIISMIAFAASIEAIFFQLKV